MLNSTHIIIVTHNSASELAVCLAHLEKQTVSINSLTIVDSGSDDVSYLELMEHKIVTKVIKADNIGFSRANNIGFKEIAARRSGMVMFVNPDTFLPSDYVYKSLKILNENPKAAIVSGKLLGFDLSTKQPTGMIDSTGIFRRWYGRWYDRGQGEKERGQYNQVESIPAVCGALMCCRIEALLSFDGSVFDPDFFLYKEDIELSLRLRKAGWDLVYDPRLLGYHCRGWNSKRTKTPYSLRLTSAKNEMLLYKKHPSPYILWAIMKFLLVRLFHL